MLQDNDNTTSVTFTAANAGTDVKFTVAPVDAVYAGVTLSSDQFAASYNISVTDLTGAPVELATGSKYTVRLFLGTDLTDVTVYHNGTPVSGVSYDSETGYVTFETDSFSQFDIVYKELSIEAINNKLASYSTSSYTVPTKVFDDVQISNSEVLFAYNNGYKVLKVTKVGSAYKYSFAYSVTTKNLDYRLVTTYSELGTKDVYAEAVALGTGDDYLNYQGYLSYDSYKEGNFYLIGGFDMEGHDYIAFNSCNNGQRSIDVGPNQDIDFIVFGINMEALYGAKRKFMQLYRMHV